MRFSHLPFLVSLCLTTFVGPAFAQDASPPASATEATTIASEPIDAASTDASTKESKGKKPKRADGTLEWKARVFARAAQEKTTVDSAGLSTSERRRLSLPSARLGFKYQF